MKSFFNEHELNNCIYFVRKKNHVLVSLKREGIYCQVAVIIEFSGCNLIVRLNYFCPHKNGFVSTGRLSLSQVNQLEQSPFCDSLSEKRNFLKKVVVYEFLGRNRLF